MCGIYGYLNYEQGFYDGNSMEYMALKLKHRGPDGSGFFTDQNCGVGNVRLAIIDPEGGQQPFYSEDKNIVVVQNGEIFNFKELKKDLKRRGVVFETDCDTEVILRLYEDEGISFFFFLNGMFAISIYDKKLGKLFLARDRIGEKPLYFHKSSKGFIFSSEIKAFPQIVQREISYSSINSFLRLNYVPAPHTAFKDIFHVMPGTYLEIDKNNVFEYRWWNLSDKQIRSETKADQWKEEFMSLLYDATDLRLVSDVPFGAFLSGGVDSSSVVGFMSQILTNPVKTYSIGFEDKRFDESIYSEEAARIFKTDHKSEVVNYDIVREWESFIYHTDQPHGDVSFMPMRQVSNLAVKDVKMVLTGDGADELFAGYEKHVPFLSRDDLDHLNPSEYTEGYMPHISLIGHDDCKKLWKEEFHNEIDWDLVDREISSELTKVSHFDHINKGEFQKQDGIFSM